MEPRKKFDIDADERAQIFHEQYGNDLDAGNTLAELVTAAGDYICRIVGDEDANAGMSRIIEGVTAGAGGSEFKNPSDWRKALDEASSHCFSEWRLGSRLHDLSAYAIYGIALHGGEGEDELSKHLEDLVGEATEFQKLTPFTNWSIGANNDLSRLVRLARNRWELDNGNPIEPAALAEFGGVSEGRIRNMMSGAKHELPSKDGRIPAQDALAWLSGRPEFWNSIWRKQSLPQYGVKKRPPLNRPVFVPVARDGSAFHPGLHRGSGYTIGEKGTEQQIPEFADALSELQRASVPYWRRPNSQGNWGTVSGVRWERLDVTDLETLAENPAHRIPDSGRA